MSDFLKQFIKEPLLDEEGYHLCEEVVDKTTGEVREVLLYKAVGCLIAIKDKEDERFTIGWSKVNETCGDVFNKQEATLRAYDRALAALYKGRDIFFFRDENGEVVRPKFPSSIKKALINFSYRANAHFKDKTYVGKELVEQIESNC